MKFFISSYVYKSNPFSQIDNNATKQTRWRSVSICLAFPASSKDQTSSLSRTVSTNPAEQSISFAFLYSNVCTCLGFFERGKTKVRLHYTDVWEDLLGVLSLETGVDNDILTCYKVRGRKIRKLIVEKTYQESS
jgi:hypothetical protein